jgi:hypothetical protein
LVVGKANEQKGERNYFFAPKLVHKKEFDSHFHFIGFSKMDAHFKLLGAHLLCPSLCEKTSSN